MVQCSERPGCHISILCPMSQGMSRRLAEVYLEPYQRSKNCGFGSFMEKFIFCAVEMKLFSKNSE